MTSNPTLKNRPLIFLMGPTASGKSSLALLLCERFPLEIVNADSVQLYQELTIGSAKPTLEEQQKVPHHLLDLTTPDKPFTADLYRQLAWKVIDNCWKRKKIPLFVGGSGLYFRAVEQGLVRLPNIDPNLRHSLQQEGDSLGWLELHQRLYKVDPTLAQRLSIKDAQRITQGLAVFATTGKSLTQWQQEQPPPPGFSILKMARLWPRPQLYERIDQRMDLMLKEGLLDEVKQLLDRGYPKHLPAMKAVGYRQLFPFLEGKSSLEEAVDNAKRESRRYAKRQMTWLRQQEKTLFWLPPEGESEAVKQVTDFFDNNGLYT